jgi:hypothetical protein
MRIFVFLIVLLVAQVAMSDHHTVWVKRGAANEITEVRVAPESLTGFTAISAADPEVHRFFNPRYSFKAEVKRRLQDDPMLRDIFEWVRRSRGISKSEALAEIDTIAQEILAD